MSTFQYIARRHVTIIAPHASMGYLSNAQSQWVLVVMNLSILITLYNSSRYTCTYTQNILQYMVIFIVVLLAKLCFNGRINIDTYIRSQTEETHHVYTLYHHKTYSKSSNF